MKNLYFRNNYNFEFFFLKHHYSLIKYLETYIISDNNKNIIIIGKEGFGKKSIIKIISAKLDYFIIKLDTRENLTKNDFEKCMMKIINLIFVENKKIILLLEEFNFVKQKFFDFVIRFLQNKEIEILNDEDIDYYVKNDNYRDLFKKKFKSSRKYFNWKISNFLSVIFILNEIVIKSDDLFIKYPMLPNITNIINLNLFFDFECFSDFILNFFEKYENNLEKKKIEELSELLFDNKKSGFVSVISFCKTIEKIYNKKKAEITNEIIRLEKGLTKISKAEGYIKDLTTTGEKKRIEMKIKQEESDSYLLKIEKIYDSTKLKKEEMLKIEQKIKEEEKHVVKRKKEVHQELSNVMPFVEKAKEEISTISKANLNELRMMPNPPKKIVDVLTALLLMLGFKKVNWLEMKKFLGKKSVLDDILNFDPRGISNKLFVELSNFIFKKKNSFDKASIYRASKAAGPIAEYIKAVLKLRDTYKRIEPLEENLEEIEEILRISNEKLNESKNNVDSINEKIEMLKKDFVNKTGEAEICKKELEKITKKILKGKELLNSLKDEKERWSCREKKLIVIKKNIFIEALFSSILINFENKLEEFKIILQQQNFDFEEFLTSPSELLEFLQNGLPNQKELIKKVLKITYSYHTPLIIDPSRELETYFVRYYNNNIKKAVICDITDKNLSQKIEMCLKFGKILIIININSYLPFYLLEIIKKNFKIKSDGSKEILFLGKDILVNKNFKMLLFSNLNLKSNIKLPFFESYLNFIDNSFNEESLRLYFLNYIVEKKNPEILKQKLDILEKEKEIKQILFLLENEILENLNNCNHEILDDLNLLKSLSKIKEKSLKTQENLKNFEKTKKKIEKDQEVFFNIAKLLANIFLTISEFEKINIFYIFSLNFFEKSLEKTFSEISGLEENFEFDKIFPKILLKNISKNYATSFFRDYLLIFSLIMLKTTYNNFFTKSNWKIITSKISSQKTDQKKPINFPLWANPENTFLEGFKIFSKNYPRIIKSFQTSLSCWQKWYLSKDCDLFWPVLKNFIINDVQKLILIKIFRKDKFFKYVKILIIKHIGLDIENLIFSPKKFSEKILKINSPILFFMKNGKDSTKEIEQLAILNNKKQKMLQISCGNTDEKKIIQQIQKNTTNWILIKNLHLSPIISSRINSITNLITKTNKIILTSEKNEFFKKSFLKNSFKIAFEKTEGIQKNMQNVYNFIPNSDLNEFSYLKAKLVFYLTFLHCVIIERDNLIPFCWSKKYNFSINDFLISYDWLKNNKLHNEIEIVKFFKNLLLECFYGSKIDSLDDFTVLKNLINFVFDNGKNFLPEIKVDDKNFCKAISELKPLKVIVGDYLLENDFLENKNLEVFFENFEKIGFK